MPMRPSQPAWLVLAAALALGAPHLPMTACAQDASASPAETEARALHAAASVAFDQGRFAEAEARFEQAYALSPRPALLYNIAAAADRAGHDDVALARYAAYLEAMPDAPNRAFVEGRVRVLRARVESSERPREGAEPVEGRGEETQEADAPTATTTIPATAIPTTGIPTTGSPTAGPDPVPPAILFGLAGATGIAAIVTGVLGWSARSELELACPARSCSDPALRSNASTMEALGVTTDVLAATSLALATAAVVVLVVSGSGDDGSERATLRLGPSGVVLAGAF
jgi:tetratricopeptide (TPR) repeat protein